MASQNSSNTSNKIFRQDFIDANKKHGLGDALLISEISSLYWIIAISIITLLVLIFIFSAQFTRRINVQGEVISSPLPNTLVAPQQGAIVDSFVKVGQQVKKGQVLFKLDVSRNTQNGNVSQKAIAHIDQQLQDIEQFKISSEANNITTLASLKSQLEHQHQAQQHTIRRYFAAQKGLFEMKKTADDYARYLKQGLVNREQVNQLRYVYYERQNAVDGLYSQVLQQSAQINEIEKERALRTTEFKAQMLQYQVQSQDLQRQQSDLNASDELLIKAPQSGIIENISVSTGQEVRASDSLIQLSPNQNTSFAVVLWLPNASIPYIHVGDAVNLRYHAFPYEKFGQFAGKIHQISKVPASQNELTRYGSAPKNNDAAFYKITILPKQHQLQWQGETLTFASGMKAEATIFLEKRRIYQWIFSPFYNMSNSVKEAQHD